MCDTPGSSDLSPDFGLLPGNSDSTDMDLGAALLGGGLNPMAVLVSGSEYGPSALKDKIFGGGGPENEASTLRAQIAREQWADYKKRFQPLENILIGYANDPKGFRDKNRGLAVDRVNNAYGRGQAQIERRLSANGLQVTPEMQDRIAKKLNYDRALSTVQASNVSDRLSSDQLQGIVSGGLLVGNRQATQKPQPG